jgi:hypothetical protein
VRPPHDPLGTPLTACREPGRHLKRHVRIAREECLGIGAELVLAVKRRTPRHVLQHHIVRVERQQLIQTVG